MGWKKKHLKDVVSFISDGDWIESRDQSESGIRLIQTGNVGDGFYKSKDDKPHYISEATFNRLGCTEIFPGDCLVSRLPEPLGRACIIPDTKSRMITAVDCSILRFDGTVLPKWFVYYTQSPCYRRDIENYTTGTTRKRISRKNLEKIMVPVPSIEEQTRVITELDMLSEILRSQKEQLDVLDELEMSIFYDSFGNPVSNTKGWEAIPLSDVSTLITDGSHYSPKDEEMGTIPMLSVKNMGERGFDYTDCKMISQEEFQKLEAAGCMPQLNDVLVAKDGSYFKRIFVHQSEAPQAILSSIAIVRPDQTKVTPEFLCTLLSTPDIYNLVEERYLTGTAIKRVILKGLRQLKIIVPPMDMQKQFSKKIWGINAQRRLIEESVVEAQKLFDSRMNYYFGD